MHLQHDGHIPPSRDHGAGKFITGLRVFSDEYLNQWNFQLRVQMTQMQLDIQSFSYEERHGILPNLTLALADCGGWVLCRKALSASTMELRLEIQLGSIFDLYVSIVSSGLELTRSGHLALTDLCNCRKNLADAAGLGQIVTVRLEISFLEEMTLQSLLLTAAASA